MKYLDSDAAYLTDDFSVIVYRMFNEGKTEEEILEKIKELNKE
jgi:cytochrome c-type biogenesis protein CcmH/NrfF